MIKVLINKKVTRGFPAIIIKDDHNMLHCGKSSKQKSFKNDHAFVLGDFLYDITCQYNMLYFTFLHYSKQFGN